MDVHASPDELLELQEFLGAFQVRFRRSQGRQALERYGPKREQSHSVHYTACGRILV
jgi:hypothetical protein